MGRTTEASMTAAKKDPPSTEPEAQLKANDRKWGKALMAPGWTTIPSVILENQKQLGIDAVDFNILMQILKHWWSPEQAPFPSKARLAGHLNVSSRTVQRHLKGLVSRGLIRRVKRRRANGGDDTTEFHFDGLIEKAKPYAVEAMKEKVRNSMPS
jgi:predicted transcriptional regulator